MTTLSPDADKKSDRVPAPLSLTVPAISSAARDDTQPAGMIKP